MATAQPITAKQVFTDLDHFVAFGMGSGLIRPAPGTWGTISGLLVFVLLVNYLSPVVAAAIMIVLTVYGTWCAHRSAIKMRVHDYGGIVIDEWVGIWITLAVVEPTALNLVVGFVLFRIFDIAKPWPIGWIDRHVSGGIGIMIDDMVAGIFSAAVLFFAVDLGWL
ncbi:phosphatidylglycerophosphatase A family protein [Umboniibacter marinipuniceus]|uniref:Phosphatidylglycerophosphatase A n=1 Tax=Umboniibacter marinipuniceus TaxID=569599 RepID=A0A3M0AD47_9GAMM|nr:phosphatidylglycerophosphatase A [Umboniibacter marinipuniceus]RMA82407.1 phosphatidylglycerophosphatase A [Umboniibacter marinipuniceus]